MTDESRRGDIVIIGGGLAGLAAAIHLARSGRAVVVHEAGSYPRHRVCGEFLSPDAEPSLRTLGLGALCDTLGATVVTMMRATVSANGRTVADRTRVLPQPARGVSRYDLDRALADAARSLGVDVRERSRIADAEAIHANRVLVTTGRQRAPIARAAGDNVDPARNEWIGVKAHARGIHLNGRVDLHFVRGAYVGLVEVVSGGETVVNVCALLRRTALGVDDAADPFEYLAAAAPTFAAQWRGAQVIDESRCTTAGFDFAIRGPARGEFLFAGDAAAVVAPFTGDGQAMALASGIDAASAILSGADAPRAVERRFAATQRSRLVLARTLQRVLLNPSLAAPLVHVLGASDRATRWLWSATRGDVSSTTVPSDLGSGSS